MKIISIIIPTYKHKNREIDLRKLLESLLIKSNLNYLQEIIIVDNGCTLSDEEFDSKCQIIRIIEEPNIGLNNARNSGIENAKGKIIAFLDDDVFVSKCWAENIYNSYRGKDVLCVGGSVILDSVNKKLPSWLTSYFTRFLFPLSFPTESGILKPPYYLIGANMSFRKDVFEKFGYFDSSLDRKGGNLLSNGDTEFIIRLPAESIYFSLGSTVYGSIKTERLTRLFMIRRLFWQGISDYIMVKNNSIINFYDKDEIFFSKSFIKIFVKKILNLRFFEFFCFWVRILGYALSPLYLILNKKRG